jgi:hypothetical protein
VILREKEHMVQLRPVRYFRFGLPQIRNAVRWLAPACVVSFLSGCTGAGRPGPPAANVLYTESNDPAGNAILAYRRAPDGTLTPLPSGPFDAGGLGLADPSGALGASDGEGHLAVSADHRLLFAVNSCSNTIAVFSIASDGRLSRVPGSPFPSGGVNPASLAIVRGRLYCANKNVTGPGVPNYTAFTIAATGALQPIPGNPVATSPAGSLASQVVASPDQVFMFTDDFLAPNNESGMRGSVRSFTVNSDGTLTQNGDAVVISLPPPPPSVQPVGFLVRAVRALTVHPTQHVVYGADPFLDVPLPTGPPGIGGGAILSFTYDAAGTLSRVGQPAPATGVLNKSLLINPAGSRMYVLGEGDDTVTVMDLSYAQFPVQTTQLRLADPGATFRPTFFSRDLASSGAADQAFDPTGQYLYVLSHRNNPDPSVQGLNRLHILKVGADGTVTEPGPSVDLNTRGAAVAQGVLVL